MTRDEPRDADGPGLGPPTVETVVFESQGIDCEADLYLPDREGGQWPAIVMANVFGAERTWGVPPFARRFAEAGIAALLFDYRHLGGSEGRPRRLIDPTRQLEDWRAAIAYTRGLEAVDGERIGLWGTSFSGGHVLATARQVPDIRAAVAQVPFVDGRATVAHQIQGRGMIEQVRTLGYALADRLGATVGLGPVSLPLVTEPGDGGMIDSRGALTGFLSLVPDGIEVVNLTPARVVLDLPTYRPGIGAGAVDIPVHVVVAEADRLLPRGPTEETVDRLRDPSVHRVSRFEEVVEAQLAFLGDTLGVEG